MNRKYIFTVSLLLICNIFMFAQSNDESWKVYDDTEVASIHISMDEIDLQFMYNNIDSDSIHQCTINFKNAVIEETVESVGIRLRGNTSRSSFKKSFKLSFNTFKVGGNFYSLEKINLNGEHNDPNTLRSKLCWDLYKDMDMISSRASHIEVYINDNYFGLYISVEHVDEEFIKKNYNDDSGNLWKCLYPANLDFRGNDPNFYKFTSDNRRAYDLKTNTNEDDYTQLARLIKILNNTPDSLFIDSLHKIVDIEEILKFYTFDILTGNWDDFWYGWNNYYFYYHPAEGKFRFIPYDYDNTLGIDFGSFDDWATKNIYNWNSDQHPVTFNRRILNSKELRNLLTHFLEFYSNNIFHLSNWESRADSLKKMITASAEMDQFKSWGFTNVDFHQSYDSIGYYKDEGIKIHRSIKEFVNVRNSSLQQQIEYLTANPIIYKTSVNKNILSVGDSLSIKASIFSSINISDVTIEIEQNGIISESHQMTFQPVLGTTEISKADRWKVKFIPTGNWTNGKLTIIAKDIDGRQVKSPKDGIDIKRVPEFKKIIITEIMSSNDSGFSDEFSEFDDWIEVFNPSDTTFDLSGNFLTDDMTNLSKWKITEGILVEPKSYLIFWCDNNIAQGKTHTNFKLSSNGESLAIVDKENQAILDFVSFPSIPTDVSYGRILEIDSLWHYFVFPTPMLTNYVKSKEQSSDVIINEIMAFNTNVITDEMSEYEDWIEIYNPQDTVLNLDGRFLTDNKLYLGKWRFPENTIINPGEYLIIWCDNDSSVSELHSNFQLSSKGEYLAIIDKDGVTVVDSVTYPELNENLSFARHGGLDNKWEISYTSTPGKTNIITDMETQPKFFDNKISVYPNPFNPTTTIEYELNERMVIELRIYDILAQVVWANGKHQKNAGKHLLSWNGKDNFGKNLSSGIYFLQLKGKNFTKLVKLMLLR